MVAYWHLFDVEEVQLVDMQLGLLRLEAFHVVCHLGVFVDSVPKLQHCFDIREVEA